VPISFWAGYFDKLAVVALILAGMYVIARRLRGMGFFGRSGRCLGLVESMMLTAHAAIHVVRVGSRYFLIGSSTGSLSMLAELAPSQIESIRRST
jgi:flagellar biogenesis protein FliO